jgi:hypothetical protein
MLDVIVEGIAAVCPNNTAARIVATLIIIVLLVVPFILMAYFARP